MCKSLFRAPKVSYIPIAAPAVNANPGSTVNAETQAAQERERFAAARSTTGLSATLVTGGLGVEEETGKVKRVTVRKAS